MTELAVRDDLHTQMKRAELLAQASLMPPSYTKQPANVLVAMEMADTLGISLMQAVQGITVINGKMSMSAEMMRALVLRAGHRFRVEVNTDQETTVLVARREWPDDEQRFTFTMDDAARAGLSGSPTWKKYPKALLLARVTSMACRAVFPDVVQGIGYVPEELEPMEAPATPRNAPPAVPTTVTVATETGPEPVDVATGEIVDADIVGEYDPAQDEQADFLYDRKTIPKDRHLVASAAQLKKIHAACRGLGYTERDDVLRLISLTLGQPIESSKDLTKETASTVIDALEALEATDDPQAAIDALAGAA